jgi:membrane protein
MRHDAPVTAPSPRPLTAARARVEPWIERAADSVLGRIWARLIELEFIDRSVALAAKAFVALFPLILAVSAFAPSGVSQAMREGLRDRLSLSGTSADAVSESLVTAEAFRSATGFFGVLLLVFYATTFATALQRVFLRAWRRPPSRGIKQIRGLAWIGGAMGYLLMISGVRWLLDGDLADRVSVVIALAGSFALWLWSQYVLLYGQVRWRALVAPAAAIAGGTALFALSTAIWLPRSLEVNQAQFGFFGVAMTLVSWLVGSAFVIVVGSALGPVLAEDPGRLGRWVRGPAGEVLRPGAAAPLQAPTGPLTLGRALGRGSARSDADAGPEPLTESDS